MRRPTEEELLEERDAQMRGQYIDPIEYFPDKIDQLLDALNRVIYFDQNLLLNYSSFLPFRFLCIKHEVFM